MKSLFKEKLEYYKANFNTWEGIFEYLISSFIWGYIIINYNQSIFNWILNILTFLDGGAFKSYLAYLIFGVIMVPLGLIITFILTTIYSKLFKNGKII